MTQLGNVHWFFFRLKNSTIWIKLLLIFGLIFGIVGYMHTTTQFQQYFIKTTKRIDLEKETTALNLVQQINQDQDKKIQWLMEKLRWHNGLSSMIRENSERTGVRGKVHLSRSPPIGTPQQTEIFNLLNKKKKGVFIECGGFDGETASNTLLLELDHQWTGILIEPNPFLYLQALGKNRNVWVLRGCLSTTDSPSVLSIPLACRNREYNSCGQTGKMSKVSNETLHIQDNHNTVCFPLAAILRTLNITTVDYFSLDIEGAEFDVLQAIPFAELNITTLSVEYKHDKVSKEVIINYMRSQGYLLHKELKSSDPKNQIYVEDFIFVKSFNSTT